MSLRVDYDERAISQAAAFLDDPTEGQHWSSAVFGVADENAPVLRVVADFDAVAAA